MRRVMIHCPQTGKMVFSGICLDEAGSTGDAFSRQNAVGCPLCGDLHFWGAEDAELETMPETAIGPVPNPTNPRGFDPRERLQSGPDLSNRR